MEGLLALDFYPGLQWPVGLANTQVCTLRDTNYMLPFAYTSLCH